MADKVKFKPFRRPFKLAAIKRLEAGEAVLPLARKLGDLPDGHFSCPVPFVKIFPFSPDPNQFTDSHRPVPQWGGSRSSRTRGGMRWTRMALLTNGA